MLIYSLGYSNDQIQIPMVNIGIEDGKMMRIAHTQAKALVNGSGLFVTITSDDINEWSIMFNSAQYYILMRVILLLLALFALVMASRLLRAWLRKKKKNSGSFKVSSVTIVCLSLQVFTNLIRLIYFSVDPILSSAIFPFSVGRPLITIPISLEFLTSILVCMFVLVDRL